MPPPESPVPFRALARADHLTETYAEAHDAYRDFQLSGRVHHLQRAAAILCAGLQRVERDRGIWQGLHDVAHLGPDERETVWSVLDDIETLLTLEAQVLGHGHPLLNAEREFLWETATSAEGMRKWPDEASVAALEHAVSRGRQAVCRRASSGDQPRRRRANSIERGMSAAGGIAIVGSNATGFISGLMEWPEAVASILTGLEIARRRT